MFEKASNGYQTHTNSSQNQFPFNKQVLFGQPEYDTHLLHSQARRDRENSELIVDNQMERYRALLAKKEKQKKQDETNFLRKMQMIKEQDNKSKQS